MRRPLNAVAAGHLCLDIFPEIDHIPAGQFEALFRPGRLIQVGPAHFATGGPVSNTGLALHKLGVPTRLVAKTGADPFGEIVRALVGQHGPDLAAGIRADPSTATSYSLIFSPRQADRLIFHHSGANDEFTAADIPYSLLDDVTLLHFGYPPIMRQMYLNGGQELVRLLRQAKDTGVTTSLDMAYPDPLSESGQAPWRTILQAALPYVDIFLPSLEELLFMLHRPLFKRLSANGPLLAQVTPAMLSDLGQELIAMGTTIVVIKLGERGLYLRSAPDARLGGLGRARPSDWRSWAGRELWAPCFQVELVGATGAGDATIAGFLSALLRDTSIEAAVRMAVAAGACNVEAADALSGLCSWEATQARIQTGWPQRDLALQAPGWNWRAEVGLWERGNE